MLALASRYGTRIAILVAALGAASWGAGAAQPAGTSPPPAAPGAGTGAGAPAAAPAPKDEPKDANGRAGQRLRTPIKASFKDVGLAEALDFIAEACNVDIVVAWPTLEQVGVQRDAPVHLALRSDTPGEVVLRHLARSLGGKFDFTIDDGAVIVTGVQPDRAKAEPAAMTTQLYDVAELIKMSEPSAPAEGAKGRPAADPAERVVRLVTQVVRPESWQQSGGHGAIVPLGTRLVVRNTDEVHAEIAKLFAMLKEGK